MRPLAILLSLAAAPAVQAGALDGFYEVVSVTDADGTRSAEALRPEGCWSREVWAFHDEQLSRGHQRRCPVGKVQETCEAWVTTGVRFDRGLVVPQDTRAVSRSEQLRVHDATKNGETVRTVGRRKGQCETSLVTARYDVTLEDVDGERVLVLTDRRREVVWRLVPGTPAAPPFAEASR